MTTLQEKYRIALADMGFREVNSRTDKYVVMEGDVRRSDQPEPMHRFFFLGKGGSVRVNSVNASSGAIAVETWRDHLLKVYNRVMAKGMAA